MFVWTLPTDAASGIWFPHIIQCNESRAIQVRSSCDHSSAVKLVFDHGPMRVIKRVVFGKKKKRDYSNCIYLTTRSKSLAWNLHTVQSSCPSDAHRTSWYMYKWPKIRVYNFNWTKSLLWLAQGPRGDADCWYFCLFKLFTHSETALILVCGTLVVWGCGAAWGTDGLSKNLSENIQPVVTVQWLCLTWLWKIPHSYFGETAVIYFKLLFEFLYIQYSRVITEETQLQAPNLFSNQWAQEKERAPFPALAHTWESVPTSILK